MEQTLTIFFMGIIMFVSEAGGQRVLIPDLSQGADVHFHHVASHEAAIVVKADSVEPSNWPYKVIEDKWFFALDGGVLTIEGLGGDPLLVDKSHRCIVPSVKRECPTFRNLRPDKELEEYLAADLRLTVGKLRGCLNKGAAYSVYSAEAGPGLTITLKTGDIERTLAFLRPTNEITIRNEPVATEDPENHFIAYYNLSPTAVCTNLPFPRPQKAACKTKDCPREIVTTVACSNSTYP